MPMAAGIQAKAGEKEPDSSASSMEGARSDQKEAASMTPAAKPSPTSRTSCVVAVDVLDGMRNTTPAPTAVRPHVRSVPCTPCATAEYPSIIVFNNNRTRDYNKQGEMTALSVAVCHSSQLLQTDKLLFVQVQLHWNRCWKVVETADSRFELWLVG